MSEIVTAPDWVGMRNRPLTREEKKSVRAAYASQYHDSSCYTQEDPVHALIHRRRAQLLLAVFDAPGKVLDAGCSAGGTVKALREHGVDAWGFDVCPDLADMAYPAARDYLRVGEFDHIPYSTSDGFETLVSYDVIEHVPIDIVEAFPRRCRDLGIRNMCCVIANDTLTTEHITIQGTEWYRSIFEAAGYRVMDEITEDLRGVLWPLPSAKLGQTSLVLHAPYEWSGDPVNGWNAVPGMMFLTTD